MDSILSKIWNKFDVKDDNSSTLQELTIEEICKKISRIFKLGYGGIDIKIFEEKIYVLEVNSIPSWKMIQKTTKKNISEILVEDFIKNLRK